MKIRTKLVLLLSTALVVTMGVSTFLRIRWTRERLEQQLSESARTTIDAISAELKAAIEASDGDDTVNQELLDAKLRHPLVADLQLNWDSDEESLTYLVPASADEPQVKKAPRTKKAHVRREEARRALLDHGFSTRRPGSRLHEALWRTPDRPDSARWPPRAQPAPPQPRLTRFAAGERGRYGVYEARKLLDPEGPRRGELVISVSREPIARLIRTESISSILITGGAVILLMMLTTLIVDRVVGRPVSELERVMQRVQGGALDARVDVVRQDEVGALSRGFNAMLERLAQADADIRAFNRRLADEVKAATLDLARKNETLAQLNRLVLETRRELGDKERMAALGQLAAQLAHEIGTPLGSVSGHLQLAMSGRDVPAALKDRLQVATRELERVSKIVRDYLDSTRTVKPERTAVDLERVIEEAIDIALGVERRAAIAVEIEVAPDAAGVTSDPALIRQILVNLTTNAADAVAPSGGHIAVLSRVVDGNVHLAVRDDGSGISPEDAARIFEPFYTTKGRGKGTGLGLAICRELATALGGKISVETEQGRGSTFTLSLPRGSEKRSAA